MSIAFEPLARGEKVHIRVEGDVERPLRLVRPHKPLPFDHTQQLIRKVVTGEPSHMAIRTDDPVLRIEDRLRIRGLRVSTEDRTIRIEEEDKAEKERAVKAAVENAKKASEAAATAKQAAGEAAAKRAEVEKRMDELRKEEEAAKREAEQAAAEAKRKDEEEKEAGKGEKDAWGDDEEAAEGVVT